MKAEIVDSKKFSKEDKRRAEHAVKEVDYALTIIAGSEKALAKDYIRLGLLLAEVEEKEFWRLTEYPTFTAYVDSIGEKVEKHRTQLFGYMRVVRQLGPYLTPEQLEEAGRTKLIELSRAVKISGMPPTPAVVKMACDGEVSIQVFKDKVTDLYKLGHGDKERGVWYDIGGFYCSPDEKKEIEQAVRKAKDMGGANSREIMLAFAREYYGTYAAVEAA